MFQSRILIILKHINTFKTMHGGVLTGRGLIFCLTRCVVTAAALSRDLKNALDFRYIIQLFFSVCESFIGFLTLYMSHVFLYTRTCSNPFTILYVRKNTHPLFSNVLLAFNGV